MSCQLAEIIKRFKVVSFSFRSFCFSLLKIKKKGKSCWESSLPSAAGNSSLTANFASFERPIVSLAGFESESLYGESDVCGKLTQCLRQLDPDGFLEDAISEKGIGASKRLVVTHKLLLQTSLRPADLVGLDRTGSTLTRLTNSVKLKCASFRISSTKLGGSSILGPESVKIWQILSLLYAFH